MYVLLDFRWIDAKDKGEFVFYYSFGLLKKALIGQRKFLSHFYQLLLSSAKTYNEFEKLRRIAAAYDALKSFHTFLTIFYPGNFLVIDIRKNCVDLFLGKNTVEFWM